MQFSNQFLFLVVMMIMIAFGSTLLLRKNTSLDNSTDSNFNISNPLMNLKSITKTITDFGNRIPSVSPGYVQTQEYINNFVREHTNYFQIEYDNFTTSTPIFGNLKMSNIIINFAPPDTPTNTKRIIMACHYESKYFKDATFVGATDSVVPLAMILHYMVELEYNYNKTVSSKGSALNLLNFNFQVVLFDGEEAFENWSPNDSLYGARHLAQQWERSNQLQNIKYLMLLDLIGTSDVRFKNYHIHTETGTNTLYDRLSAIEYSKFKENKYFDGSSYSYMDDDHRPFLERGVPILHLISEPFPSVWHTLRDDYDHLDWNANDKIYRVISSFMNEQLLNSSTMRKK
ncbi:hypothetical protein FDP41_009307 [Naegleria fowleri]|uniref:Peptidase M28 domain-containing protein n=1 Tax=Naegleria fowleri TaxID=5763 RepID=A0A6A5BEA1_NAEFO|nr:uncharacterized protein FDP41_009307 [Naegleria fowleri]KAF0972404.1 hypothetical protein FDP41_009307 [Naegleria fowleri]